MVLVRAGEGERLESRQSSVEDIKVPAGEAVDIFYRYGQYLTQYLSQYLVNISPNISVNIQRVNTSFSKRFLFSLGSGGSTRRPRLVADPRTNHQGIQD